MAVSQAWASVPYWRLSSFYFFYFALLGALLPYWGLYLQSIGFSLSEIGTLMACLLGTKLFAPNVWGWIADRTGRRLAIIRLGGMLALAIFCLILLRPAFVGTALIMIGFGCFWNAILPQFEVLTLRTLGPAVRHYSRIRLWGSVGFIALVLGLGWGFEVLGSVASLPFILITLLALILVSSLVIPARSTAAVSAKVRSTGFLQEFLQRPVLVFFGLCFLMQISHGPYYSFYSIYAQDHGFTKTTIGWLWSWGVLAEIGVFLIANRLFDRFGEHRLLVFCLAATTLRWWATGYYPDEAWVQWLAQGGHAISFGLFHALAIARVNRYFTDAAAGQGQAMYSALSFGAGNAFGAWAAGWIMVWGSGSDIFFAAAAVTLLATLLALALPERPSRA